LLPHQYYFDKKNKNGFLIPPRFGQILSRYNPKRDNTVKSIPNHIIDYANEAP